MIGADEYATFLSDEYLDAYVSIGGAAVKFIIPPDDDTAAAFSSSLHAAAMQAGFMSLKVDAVATRVHLMDQVFFDVAHQLDWTVLARVAVRRAMSDAGYPPPVGSGATESIGVEALAAHHRVDPVELSRDLNRQLQLMIVQDYAMVHEFRVAMLRLCQADLATGQVSDAERDAVIAWLHGVLRQMSVLRSAMIFRRIGRHNARTMLFSACHWAASNGFTGLVIELDVRRLGFARRPLPEERDGFYYTKTALLDAYELLRQLVDNTDALSNCCVVVIAAPEFLTDDNRGVSAYQALKLRVHDEVRDRTRDNPFASLVRLGPS
jgi:bacteriophage exclusion system BrxC/D-like protein